MATFSMVATGSAPLSYQWRKSGTTISGATSASYTTPATAPADSGSTFTVVVSNPFGSVTSSPAPLTVAPSRCDLNADGATNSVDLQQLINAVLADSMSSTFDLNRDSRINVVDMQVLVDVILGWGHARHDDHVGAKTRNQIE
jgi:hypothetical protein